MTPAVIDRSDVRPITDLELTCIASAQWQREGRTALLRLRCCPEPMRIRMEIELLDAAIVELASGEREAVEVADAAEVMP